MQVAGFLSVEQISQGYRLLPRNGLVTCSLRASPVVCGVSRLWVHLPYRKKKVASRLLDALRRTYMLGLELGVNQVAFSDPTPDGRAFASKYFKTEEFLVYNYAANS